MGKTFKEMVKIIDDFCEQRKWDNGEPNHLISSIYIELGELAENYQWQHKFNKELTEEEKRVIGYEFVDVIFYLFRLASKTGVDIEKYFDEKVPKLQKKFPVKKVLGLNNQSLREIHDKYRKEGKNKLYS